MSVIVVVAGGYAVLASVMLLLVWAWCRAGAIADRHEARAQRAAPLRAVPDQPASPRPALPLLATPPVDRRGRRRLAERLSAGVMAMAESVGPFRSHPR